MLLGVYLSGTWMFRMLPSTYYEMEGRVNWFHVAACLLVQVGLILDPLLVFDGPGPCLKC